MLLNFVKLVKILNVKLVTQFGCHFVATVEKELTSLFNADAT
jgi:hypothetical protein